MRRSQTCENSRPEKIPKWFIQPKPLASCSVTFLKLSKFQKSLQYRVNLIGNKSDWGFKRLRSREKQVSSPNNLLHIVPHTVFLYTVDPAFNKKKKVTRVAQLSDPLSQTNLSKSYCSKNVLLRACV